MAATRETLSKNGRMVGHKTTRALNQIPAGLGRTCRRQRTTACSGPAAVLVIAVALGQEEEEEERTGTGPGRGCPPRSTYVFFPRLRSFFFPDQLWVQPYGNFSPTFRDMIGGKPLPNCPEPDTTLGTKDLSFPPPPLSLLCIPPLSLRPWFLAPPAQLRTFSRGKERGREGKNIPRVVTNVEKTKKNRKKRDNYRLLSSQSLTHSN